MLLIWLNEWITDNNFQQVLYNLEWMHFNGDLLKSDHRVNGVYYMLSLTLTYCM